MHREKTGLPELPLSPQPDVTGDQRDASADQCDVSHPVEPLLEAGVPLVCVLLALSEVDLQENENRGDHEGLLDDLRDGRSLSDEKDEGQQTEEAQGADQSDDGVLLPGLLRSGVR